MRQVAYARSTWHKAEEFQNGVKKLASEMPLSAARTYLLTGIKSTDFEESLYGRIDELQEIRKSGIAAEMQYVKAQIVVNSQRDPEVAEKAALSLDHTPEDAKALIAKAIEANRDGDDYTDIAGEFLGEKVLTGDDIRFGFGPEVLQLAPSLGVYTLFMWFDKDELD